MFSIFLSFVILNKAEQLCFPYLVFCTCKKKMIGNSVITIISVSVCYWYRCRKQDCQYCHSPTSKGPSSCWRRGAEWLPLPSWLSVSFSPTPPHPSRPPTSAGHLTSLGTTSTQMAESVRRLTLMWAVAGSSSPVDVHWRGYKALAVLTPWKKKSHAKMDINKTAFSERYLTPPRNHLEVV